MRFVQLVMGPAGVGKSTYCKVMQEHCKTSGRIMHIGNLDPAAENFEYDPVFDIKQVVKRVGWLVGWLSEIAIKFCDRVIYSYNRRSIQKSLFSCFFIR